MVSVLRSIKKLLINSTVAVKFASWKIEGVDVERESNIIFADGLISLNSDSRALIHQLQAEKYGLIVNDGAAIIEAHSLTDGDLFIGRIDNYLLFRSGDIDLNSKDFNVNIDNLNLSAQQKITLESLLDFEVSSAQKITLESLLDFEVSSAQKITLESLLDTEILSQQKIILNAVSDINLVSATKIFLDAPVVNINNLLVDAGTF